MKRALFLVLAAVAACGGGDGAVAPVAQPQPVPPPAAFNHPGFVYYNGAQPQAVAPVMPPMVNIRSNVDVAHLRQAAAQPRRCNEPLEVADGVFVHVDCYPYRRIPIAVKHASALKLNLMRQGRSKWNPAMLLGGATTKSSLTGSVGASNDAAALPDMVDHRLNGTEGPIKDQEDVGACTAFSFSSVMDNALRRANQNITTSPEHVWAHYGSPTMEDAATGNLNKGLTTFEALPYSGREACEIMKDTSDDCGGTYGVRVNSAAADGALQNKLRAADAANGHRAIAYEELEVQPPNFDEMMTTLASGADLWVAFNIDSSVWVNRRMQSFVIPDWTTPDGGHAVALAGYRKVNGSTQFLVHNSWGQSWGDKGYAWVSQAMVQRWMHLAYKVKTDVDAGAPSNPIKPKTDEDCAGDQVVDSVTGVCAGVCPDQSRPANGQCPSGPAPAPQPLGLPTLPGWPSLPNVPAIPGWFPFPNTPAQPAQPAQPGQQPAQPAQPAQQPALPPGLQWPWPVPTTLPQFFPTQAAPPK